MAPPNPDIKVNSNGIPDFDDLPLREGDPHHSAWGLYGERDELGTLNRLTDERVAAAARREIRTGRRVSLNWPLDAQSHSQPGDGGGGGRAYFQRARFHQDMFPKAPALVNDDVWTFNSQVSTQWDGLRHFGYQKEKVFYNGVTMKEIHGFGQEGEGTGKKSTVNGIQGKCCFLCDCERVLLIGFTRCKTTAWAEQGIVGRGILVDYHGWRTSQPDDGKVSAYDSFESTSISLADLQACLEAQGTEVKFGDILFIRSGKSLPFLLITINQNLFYLPTCNISSPNTHTHPPTR